MSEKANLVGGSTELTKIFRECAEILFSNEKDIQSFMVRQLKNFAGIDQQTGHRIVIAVTVALAVGESRGRKELMETVFSKLDNE